MYVKRVLSCNTDHNMKWDNPYEWEFGNISQNDLRIHLLMQQSHF